MRPLSLRSPSRIALCVGLFLLHGALPAMATSHLVYFGTYTKTTSRGIYAARLDDATGALSAPVLVAETPNASWVVLSPDQKVLYASHASRAQVAAFSVNRDTGALTPLPLSPLGSQPANAPSHIAVDATNRMVIAANYGEGFVASMRIQPDGTLGAPNIIQHTGRGTDPKRQDKPHVHSVTISPDNRHAIVCDLGLDKVFTYRIDPATAALTPAHPAFVTVEPGSGPRHFAFSVDGRHGYALTEMGATLVAFDYDAARGALTPVQAVSMVPQDFIGLKWAAEVRVHPNGRFVYASNRTHDSIAVFAADANTGKLTLIEIIASGGKTPRNFALSPSGKWLVCAHQDSDNVTVFAVDANTGRLTLTPHSIQVAMAVCVRFQ